MVARAQLANRFYDGLSGLGVDIVSPEDKELRSGVVSFSTKDNDAVHSELKKEGYIVSRRTAGIRVSTGFFNTEEEVDSLLGTLKKLL